MHRILHGVFAFVHLGGLAGFAHLGQSFPNGIGVAERNDGDIGVVFVLNGCGEVERAVLIERDTVEHGAESLLILVVIDDGQQCRVDGIADEIAIRFFGGAAQQFLIHKRFHSQRVAEHLQHGLFGGGLLTQGNDGVAFKRAVILTAVLRILIGVAEGDNGLHADHAQYLGQVDAQISLVTSDEFLLFGRELGNLRVGLHGKGQSLGRQGLDVSFRGRSHLDINHLLCHQYVGLIRQEFHGSLLLLGLESYLRGA